MTTEVIRWQITLAKEVDLCFLVVVSLATNAVRKLKNMNFNLDVINENVRGSSILYYLDRFPRSLWSPSQLSQSQCSHQAQKRRRFFLWSRNFGKNDTPCPRQYGAFNSLVSSVLQQCRLIPGSSKATEHCFSVVLIPQSRQSCQDAYFFSENLVDEGGAAVTAMHGILCPNNFKHVRLHLADF